MNFERMKRMGKERKEWIKRVNFAFAEINSLKIKPI